MASINRDEISRLELLHAAHPDGLVFPHLADAYRRAGRYAQAETVLTSGLRRHSEYSSAHVVLGRLRLDQGKYVEAQQAFQRVLELDPKNHVAMEYLGQVSLEQGRLEDALKQFRALARLKPSAAVQERVRELTQRVAEAHSGDGRSNGSGEARAPATGTDGPSNGTAGVRPAGPEATDAAPDPGPGNDLSHSARPDAGGGTSRSDLMEPGEVVTETMAELYTRQGLHDRAAAVYRQLLDRSPGDRRLRAKLEAVQGELEHAPHPAPAPVTIRDQLSTLLRWEPVAQTGASVEPQPGARPEPEPMSAPDPVPEPVPEPELEPVPEPATDPLQEPWAAAAVTLPVEGTPIGVAEAWPAEPLESPPAEPLEPAAPDAGAAGVSGSLDVEAETAPRTHVTARSLIAITDMLVGLLEYRDPFFRGSSSLTRLMAEKVAEEMGLDAAERSDLALAAVLRDLGRLAMGGRLVSQTGHQTPEGRRKIERHVDLALQLLEGIDLPRRVRLAVRHHHERWDGAGYPDGLAGESIPPLARVLAVVDSFAAMVSPRSYRLPRKVPDAAREISEAAGTHYDPAVVRALMHVVGRQEQPHLGFAQRPHLLLVNPDQPGAVITAARLCSAGYLAEVSSDPAAARERLRRVPVAALVVSAETGADAVTDFVRGLRADPLFSSLPVVVVDAPTVDLRVRLLESGADVCFPPGTSYAELQGTLAALVRRTLWTTRAEEGEATAVTQEAGWLALQGDIEDFPLSWLLQVMKYDSRTAAIGIRTGSEDGAIYLHNGDAVHAQIRGGPSGEAALRRMVRWEKGHFTVQPDARPRERTIQTSTMHLLLRQAVDDDHAAADIFGAITEEG